jgi:23S rRNA pseudouridine2605 synthase
MAEAMRIQRALARAGVASRRKAEELVAAGRVRVNGAVAVTGQTVEPGRDEIIVDGKKISLPALHTWVVLNKPPGVMTTASDPQGRRTVFDLVPPKLGLTYVGRLDYMTEGVLLLTTDGEAAHKLTHPSHEIERTYVATVRGNAAEAARMARGGVELEDGIVKPLAISALKLTRGLWDLEITLAEGRTREVRRMCEALGLEIERLVRTQFGPVKLGMLPSGKSRALSVKERDLIDALTYDSAKEEKKLKRDEDEKPRSREKPKRDGGGTRRGTTNRKRR